MLPEYSSIVLTAPVASTEAQLLPGQIGVIVHVHPNSSTYIVEFFNQDGDTIAVEDVEASQLRPITDQDRHQARATA